MIYNFTMVDDFLTWIKNKAPLNEAETRYSVEVNYRTTTDDALKQVAKITLGYASAALKKEDFHVKQVFEEDPLRILVSSRKWDDGEWVVVVSWNPKKACYIITPGYYNKDRKTVSYKRENSKDCEGKSASEITRAVKNAMHHLKKKPDRHVEKLKSVPKKRGPK